MVHAKRVQAIFIIFVCSLVYVMYSTDESNRRKFSRTSTFKYKDL